MKSFDVIKFLLFSLAISLCFCSCRAQNESPPEEIVQNAPETIEHDSPEPVMIPDFSPLATPQFLLPYEDFSWEREYPAEFVMIHFTSAVVLSPQNPYELSSVRGIFEENGLSIHYIIDREGNIFCWMPETRCAWHAGKGEFANDSRLTNNMNRYSIGIELLAMGSQSDMAQYLTPDEYNALDKQNIGFTDKQYEALRGLVSDICDRNEIPMDREHVIGHDMYNPAKTDPGELFLWEKIFD